MEFVNATDLNARFINTILGVDRMLGAVIARPTFRLEGPELVPTGDGGGAGGRVLATLRQTGARLVPFRRADRAPGTVLAEFRMTGSRLVPSPDDPWPIEVEPVKTPHGEFPADTPCLNGGVDVFVVGQAHQPSGRTGRELRVDIKVGSGFRRSIRVVGDRVWRRRRGKLVASDPVPFSTMPLTYDRAYGGKLELDEGEVAWPANPHGKGFYLREDQAEGQPLPNLEDPERPITGFMDRPPTVGTAPYPMDGSLRALNAVQMSPDNRAIERIKPLFFNGAHPDLIIPPAQAPKGGDLVEVTNVHPGGPLRFALPDLALHVHVQLEERSYVCPLHLDQIAVLTDDAKVFLSYRVGFKYRLVPHDRRRTTLHPGAVPESVPADYVTVWGD